ncbi:MAG: hypothetical protein E7226_07065 [Clostridiales bacterium]|nr:hypothetical protein [Clostridiales bacterium]
MAFEYDTRRRENPAEKRLTSDELRSIRNARNSLGLKLGKYGAIAAAILSAMSIFGAGSMLDVMVTAGLTMLWIILAILLHVTIKRRQTKWSNYEALINWEGNTSLDYIAQNTGYPKDKVVKDLQFMIDKKFLIGPRENLGAYIDIHNDLLVMTEFGTGKPLEPVEEAIKRKKAQEKIRNESDSIKTIRQAVLEISDEEMRDCLFELSGSIGKIEKKLKENPELEKMDIVRKFDETYLPRTLDLIEKYRKGDGSPETMAKIKETLGICAEAFDNIEESIYNRESEDTLADIEVIKQLLAREGFLDSDFQIPTPKP